MTFELQIEGLTGLTISSSATTPTQTELTQFLRDGVIEVVNRIIDVKPEEMVKFSTSTHDDSDSGITVTGRILGVVREHDDISMGFDAHYNGTAWEASDESSFMISLSVVNTSSRLVTSLLADTIKELT